MKITAISQQPRSNKGFVTPISPKITEKKRKRKTEHEREKRKSNNLLFLYCK